MRIYRRDGGTTLAEKLRRCRADWDYADSIVTFFHGRERTWCQVARAFAFIVRRTWLTNHPNSPWRRSWR